MTNSCDAAQACNHFRLYNGKAAEAELRTLKVFQLVLHGTTILFQVLHGSKHWETVLMQDLTDNNYGDNDLIRHNIVVFRNGENAMSVLPKLMDVIPEARLNLVIYHLRNNDINEAHELVKDLKPNTPQEYILKGVVHASLGQSTSSSEHLKTAQQYFQLVSTFDYRCPHSIN